MDETGAEIVQAKSEGNVVTRLVSNLRRALSGKPQNTQPETPSVPQELTLEQQITQSEAKEAQLAAEQKNIVDRSLGDMTLEDRRMATAKQAERENEQRVLAELRTKAEANQVPKPETSEQPTAVPVAPSEQQPPAEEPAVA